MKHSIKVLAASALFISASAFAHWSDHPALADNPELYSGGPAIGVPAHDYKDDAGELLFGPEMYGSIVADVMLGRDKAGNDDHFPHDAPEYTNG